MTVMPCPAKFQVALAAIAPATAISGAGYLGRYAGDHENAGYDCRRKRDRGQVYVRDALIDLDQLPYGLMGFDLQPEHSTEHCNADLKAHSGKKSHQHGLREEVSQKAQLQNSGQQQQSSGQQGHGSSQRHISRAGQRRHGRDSARKNGCCGRIGSHDQVSRRTEHGKGQHRQQERVKPRDHGHAGDPGITQSLRDIHRRQLHSRHGIANRPRPAQRPYAFEQRQPVALLSACAHFLSLEFAGLSGSISWPNFSSSRRSLR